MIFKILQRRAHFLRNLSIIRARFPLSCAKFRAVCEGEQGVDQEEPKDELGETKKNSAAASLAAGFSSSNKIPNRSNDMRSPMMRLEDVVKGRCQSENFDIKDALQLFDEMLCANPKPSTYLFNILFTRIMRIKDNPSRYSALLTLYREMNRARGVSPDVFTYGIVIDCFIRTSRVDFGFSVFGIMLKRGWRCDTVIFSILIRGLCLEKRVDDAADLLDRMPQWGCSPNTITCNTLVKGLCGIRNSGKALDFLQEMKTTRGVDCMPNVVTYSTIIGALFKDGALDKVAELLEEMADAGIRPNVVTYTTLIYGYTTNGYWKEGVRVFKKMVDEGLSPNEEAFSSLVDSLCKHGTMIPDFSRHVRNSTNEIGVNSLIKFFNDDKPEIEPSK